MKSGYVILLLLLWFFLFRPKRKAGKRSAVKQPTQNRTSPKPQAPVNEVVSAEGESPEEHSAHLIQSSQEGESEEEHAEHMRFYDQNADRSEAVSPHVEPNAVTSRDVWKRDSESRAQALRRSIVAKEILDSPVSLRDPRF